MNLESSKNYNIPPELRDIIPGYLGRRDQDILELKAAYTNNDFQKIGKIAHKLKGNGASYGFNRLTELGIELMNSCQTQNRAEVFQLLLDFEAEVENIKANI